MQGGGERYVTNMARGLARVAGEQISVEIVAPAAVAGVREVEPGVSLRGVPVQPASASYGQGVSWDLIEAVIDADVVHVHQAFTRYGETAALAGRIFGRVVCVTDHGGTTSTFGRRLGLVDLADAAVAYSRFGAAALGSAAPVTVIEGGVDATFFAPVTSGPRDRIVYAGRIMAHKGIDVLLRASPPGVNVTVVGTVIEPEYFALLHELAATRDVTFVHDANDDALREQYSRAIAVVLPSVHVDVYGRVHPFPELMGLTALEGMACGAPAVVMRTGGLPEYVEDGTTGFVVESEAELRERLQLLVSDRTRAASMGEAARARVVTRWDITHAAATLLSLYQRLLES